MDFLSYDNLHCLCICQVEYQCDGFLEKNKDTVNEEQIHVLKASKVSENMSSASLKECFSHQKAFYLLINKGCNV